jgi:hypothetical protein
MLGWSVSGAALSGGLIAGLVNSTGPTGRSPASTALTFTLIGPEGTSLVTLRIVSVWRKSSSVGVAGTVKL